MSELEQQFEEPEVDEAGDDEQTVEKSPEEQAALLGWSPEEGYKGKKPWVDAATFLAGRKDNLAMAEHDVKRLAEGLAKSEKRAAKLEKAIESLKGFEQRAYKQALADLERKHHEAVDTGDHVAANEAVAEMRELERDAAEAAKPEADPVQQWQADLSAWEEKNDWFSTDANRRLYADSLPREMGAAKDWPGGNMAYLEEVTRRVEAKFRSRPLNPVNGGGNRPNGKVAKKGFSSLDHEQKAVAIEMEKMNVMSREEYAAQYLAE